ncbi:PBP1A family penicillin-binding protein [Patescibacteria group bacterium]|nr:PBP1A family penicillin-binding protein [Patescibacteria group bacterium]
MTPPFLERLKTSRPLQISLIAIATAILITLIYLYKQLPSPNNLTSSENFPVSTQIFDRNGELLYEIYGNENRIPVQIDQLPEHLLQATVAIEDKKFYSHHGLDITGLIRASFNNFSSGSLQGGSTITQQLVKNALLTNEKTFSRKIKEAVLAIMTEVLYSKNEILEMYLNYISYGGTAVGVEAAANKYFDKSAKDLSLAEASLLAGLPQSPTTYSPFGSNPEKGKARQKEVLRRMVEDKYISQEEADAAAAEVLTFAISRTDIKAPHFVFYIKDLLYTKYGEKMVETGGLRVKTTLDLDLQETAQASLSAEVAKLANLKVGNGAALVTKPNTGEILAMIGSKDYFDSEEDGQVNVALALRQPGSSIKPIMYATAFAEKTLNPGSMILDIPTCFKVAGQKDYCPKNYTGAFLGPVTIRQSLGNSLNIPAVKALTTIGLQKFINQATAMGITTWTDPANYGLSLTLGGGEVKMTELAEAFGVLANQGVKIPLTGILEISNYKGEVLEEYDSEEAKADLTYLNENDLAEEENLAKRVMDRAPAYLTSHILQDNNARQAAFGSNSELVIKNKIVSAKTGTTNDLKDNWTVGYTPEYLTIVWVGNNDGKSMSYLASGITGAAPIWHDIMQYILQDEETVWPEKPADVKIGNVCLTGMPPQAGLGSLLISTGDNETSVSTVNTDTDPVASCESKGQELYWESSKPSYSGTFRKEYWIRAETGLPPAEGEEATDLNLEEHAFYYDPLTKLYCADCARPVDEEGKTIYEQQMIDVKNIF